MLDVYHETAMTNIHTRCLTAKSYTVRHSQTVSVKAEGGGVIWDYAMSPVLCMDGTATPFCNRYRIGHITSDNSTLAHPCMLWACFGTLFLQEQMTDDWLVIHFMVYPQYTGMNCDYRRIIFTIY